VAFVSSQLGYLATSVIPVGHDATSISGKLQWPNIGVVMYGCHHLLEGKTPAPNYNVMPKSTTPVLQISGLALPYLQYTLSQGMIT
jgi:hypothetical protein